ncbi:hypothetical protein F5141DRAFT_1063545 [Pisolithus sp. B1]|nr:hypothetical protein F5141DRAFT_1063545 [Pisolithus sp. B1]
MVQDRLTVPSSTGSPSASSSSLSSEIPMTTFPTKDPAVIAEVALAVQLERSQVTEALATRDNAGVRLEDGCTSVRQKSVIISRLERELEILRRSFTSSPMNPSTLQELQHSDSCTGTEDQTDDEKGVKFERHVRSDSPSSWVALSSLSLEGGAEKTVAARHSILAAFPLPSDVPEEELQPIFLPGSYSSDGFLRNATGCVLAQVTTYWCADREEHGCFFTLVFKCTTNPRVVTVHRWLAVDVLGRVREPTECFYHKDGQWYYAGTYRAFRTDDLTTQERELFSTEVQEMVRDLFTLYMDILRTTQALVKETLAGRKNVSPQNTYETGQLYAVGALRISCVGLQCIGFNNEVYHAVLEQSRFVHWTCNSGWTSPTPPGDDSKSSIDREILPLRSHCAWALYPGRVT